MFDSLMSRSTALGTCLETSLSLQTRGSQTGFSRGSQSALLQSDAEFGLHSSTSASRLEQLLSPSRPESPPLPAPFLTTPAQWTVMVYMSADTLETFAIQDFLEMAAIGSSANVNIVVQLDRTTGLDSSYGDWTDTRRGLVQAGDTPTNLWGTSLGEVDMGDVNALADFVNWSMGNYQAENYALVTWGHGSGFGVAYDDLVNDNFTQPSYISAQELNTVLSTARDRIDLVGADACLMGMTEFVYEIRNSASVFVGSQELEPGTGWDYTPILADLTRNPLLTAAQFGSSIVQHYGEFYTGIGNTSIAETLSAIDLSALQDTNPNNLGSRFNQFATIALTTATANDLRRLDQTRDMLANTFGKGSFPDYCDVGRLFDTIAEDDGFSLDVRAAAQAIVEVYSTAIISNFSSDGRGTGLSFYFSNKGFYARSDYTTQFASFTANTAWDEFLNSSRW